MYITHNTDTSACILNHPIPIYRAYHGTTPYHSISICRLSFQPPVLEMEAKPTANMGGGKKEKNERNLKYTLYAQNGERASPAQQGSQLMIGCHFSYNLCKN